MRDTFGIVATFAAGLALGCLVTWQIKSTPPKPKEVLAADVRWQGRFVASDGANKIFSMSQVEIGLGPKGVVMWRFIPPTQPQIQLKSEPSTLNDAP